MSGGSLSAPDPLHLYVGVRISNLAGSDTKFYNMNQRVSIHPNHFLRPGPYSGCPFLLIKNNNGFVYENNILHKSEFPENKDKDITDKLVLKNVPEINTGDSTITLAIDENSIDRSYFDNFRLVSIDHPSNTIAAVTNSNELVILDASQISSPIVAEHEGVDVTDILQYDTADSKSVEGLTKNQMQAKFSAAFQTSDSIAIIFDASPPPKFVIPVVKDIAGEITAQDEYGGLNNIPINFAMRQLSSPVIVPVSAGANIVSAYMNWKRDFNISYFSCVPIRYSGFSQSENELVYAQDIVAGNILQLLKHEDNVYAELDSTTSILLKFKVNLLQPPAGMKRSYMLVSTGRYEKPAGYNSQQLNSNTEITIDENSLEEVELLPNIPNPFNPVTLIRFNLPQESNAEVSVYDITGKVVANIFQGKLTKGMHRFTFDGSTLSSGAYYVRLKTEKRSLVRKMMLVK